MPTWTEQPRPLPTLPGMVTGIIESWDQPKPRITVQCSTCLRTLTDDVFWAVNACNFRPDAGTTGHTKYRRCRDCVTARRHPEAR